ncbi:Bifunctional ligase/repressor BirA [compost metagenome]
MLISLAINRSLTAYLGNETRIKWPNDIYYLDKKIGGILIENTLVGNVIKAAIIGIGINVNQMSFEEDLADKATSMGQILKKEIHLSALLHSICNEIESLYLQQRGNINNKLRQMYVEKLYRFNQLASYQKNGEVFDGTITGISEEGLLQVDISGRQHEFNFKEIKFLDLF